MDSTPITNGLIQLCIGHPEVPTKVLDDVIDFVNFRAGEDPGFSLQGRSMPALIRIANDWHREQDYSQKKFKHYNWETSGIDGFSTINHKDDEVHYYFIEELRHSKSLMHEGELMKNCVFTYSSLCKNKQCAVFTLRMFDGEKEHALGTIEVAAATQMIVQARAKYNGPLSSEAQSVMEVWAANTSLKISRDI
jgi:hypothetical protein